MKSKFLGGSLLTLLLLSGVSLAQIDPYINIQILGPFEIYYIGDLDPAGRGAGTAWLDVQLYGFEGAATTVTMDFTHETELIFTGTSNPLYFSDGDYLRFTNLDFSRQEFIWQGGSVEIEDWDFNEDYLEEVDGNALASGMYRVTITLTNLDTGKTFPKMISFTATNPDAVWLISPRDGFTVTLPEPVFIWSSAAQLFRIRVCRAEEGQMNGEDVIANLPVWEEELSGYTATYPPGDVQELQNGATYYWQVYALVSTTSGDLEFASEIWSFKYSDEGNYLEEETLEVLGNLFPGNAGEVLNQLVGYHMSGTIMVDGMPLDSGGLEDFLDSARNGEVEGVNLSVE